MFFVSLIACFFLINFSNSYLEITANTIYSIGLCGMFGISALYHRLNCSIKIKLMLRKLDHCGIFIMIAGSFTPICLLALPNESGSTLLIIVWSLALLGIIQSIFLTRIHRWARASLYLIVGYMAFPFIKVLYLSLSLYKIILIGAGGLVYSIGAVGYGLKFPKLNPKIFGFHEMFHLLVIIAAILHFIVIYNLT
tara:strand:+ start:200 stop:784 length:585 start_codon:yes stop_codon:yes gene_type:complete